MTSSPYDYEIDELQLIDIAPPFWRISEKILSRQLSMLETERELAWEKKRHQMRMHERKRELTIESPNELSYEDLNELKKVALSLGLCLMKKKVQVAENDTVPRNQSSNGGERACRNGKASPATEPPSPRVPVCGLCRAFDKPMKTRTRTGTRENPQQVKTKLRHWAQLVACSVMHSS
ncbi:hypothetical protein L1987_86265 [Smallanthus sonchifolius]|uniref:Uncharacterized protein n=1 Tax=Smallanthus sonchifolius TaxID=185202 RepID=A0ACB8XZN9_9ASTR|nr:hypothetical protein L1987_86265 [Smallanthus sonchifolius]